MFSFFDVRVDVLSDRMYRFGVSMLCFWMFDCVLLVVSCGVVWRGVSCLVVFGFRDVVVVFDFSNFGCWDGCYFFDLECWIVSDLLFDLWRAFAVFVFCAGVCVLPVLDV